MSVSSFSKILAQASVIGASVGAGILISNNTDLLQFNNSKSKSQSIEDLLRGTTQILNERMLYQETANQNLFKTILALNEKIAKYESDMERLKHISSDSLATTPIQTTNGDVNTFELSKILEANNHASQRTLKRRLRKQRETLSQQAMAKVDEEIEKVENKYRPIVMGISALEAELALKQELIQKEAPARIVWLACQGLFENLKFNTLPKPLENDPSYVIVKQFAGLGLSPLASLVVASLPERALKEGIYSEQVLASRFDKIAKLSRRVSTIDENSGGISRYFLAFVQSLLIIRRPITVTREELEGHVLVDPTVWSTYEIIERVSTCLREHNLEQALRYANQLRGQPRLIAYDWIHDARLHLEAKRAINIIATHATSVQEQLASMAI